MVSTHFASLSSALPIAQLSCSRTSDFEPVPAAAALSASILSRNSLRCGGNCTIRPCISL